MSYAIIYHETVIQISDAHIVVAEPMECVEIEPGQVVRENYTAVKGTDGKYSFSVPDAPKGAIPEVQSPSLQDQAQWALGNVQSRSSMIVAMGKTFGDKTKAYVASLESIINGTDTKSTSLPDAPEDLTT